MRISTPLADITDQLISFISEGFGIIGYAFENRLDQGIVNMQQEWIARVTEYFDSTFPTKKESGQFECTPVNDGLFYNNMHASVKTVVNGVNTKVQILESILGNLERYYQFEPETCSVDIQHIDSFEKVRGVNHRDIEPYVNNGFFNRDEGTIKRAFAEIIGESFVPKDWGGETEDLFTSRTLLNAQRVSTSIIFNGPGKIKSSQTRLSDLGKRGDLFLSMIFDPNFP